MKNWKNNRPDGWVNPCMGKVGGDLGYVFETGADAMLRGVLELLKDPPNYTIDGEKIFSFGGPTACEYRCLEGIINILEGRVIPEEVKE